MRLYWELIQLAFRRQLAYRGAAMAGLLTNLFFGLLRAAVMAALFGARQEVTGMSLQDAVTYTGISQATIGFISLFGWYDLIRSVYTGQVGSDLLKPMDFFKFWFAQDMGRAAANILLRGIPLILLYALFFEITVPTRLLSWPALFLAVALASMVSFSFRFLINLASFWVPNATGIARLAFTISWFLSGFMMPLRFFPDWFVRLCYLTPFPHIINTIVEVYLELLTPAQVAAALANQLIWVALLVAACYLVLRLGVRRLVILGG